MRELHLYRAHLGSICSNFFKACPRPNVTYAFNSSDFWTSTPRPNNTVAPSPGNSTFRVLHLSDFQSADRGVRIALTRTVSIRVTPSAPSLIAPTRACADPSTLHLTRIGMCCRPQSFNSASKNATVAPAPRFGAFSCDTPFDLALAALQSVPVLLGVNGTSDLAFTLCASLLSRSS